MKKRLVKILSIGLVTATFLMGCANKTEEASISDVNAETSENGDASSQGDEAETNEGVATSTEVSNEDNSASGEEAVDYKADPNGTCVDPNEFAKLLEKYGQAPFWDVLGTGYKMVDTAFTTENQCSVRIADVYEYTAEYREELINAMKQFAETYKAGVTEGPNGFCIKLQEDKNHFYDYYFYCDESCVIYIAITASREEQVPEWIDDFAVDAGIWSK